MKSMMVFVFFNDTATTEIYTLSLHDALPISDDDAPRPVELGLGVLDLDVRDWAVHVEAAAVHRVGDIVAEKLHAINRSEEHTSELQSRQYLVCRLLLEKKKKILRLIFYYKLS